jgi:acyl-CoA thioester hydrolase
MRQPFHHELRVRYHECDAQGILFNAHYLAFFDISLTELWRAAFGGYAVMTERGIDVVVAEAQLRFRAPARFDEVLRLGIAVTRLGESGIGTAHTVARGGELLAEGTMRHVCVDARALRRTVIPGWAREGLAPWTVVQSSDGAAGSIAREPTAPQSSSSSS